MNRRRKITSIKPGRGPSFMGGIGSVAAIIFGIFWTVMAFQMTRNSPFGGVAAIFPLFGVVFILLGVVNAVYSFRNATAKKRYSVIDITDSGSEPDPLNELSAGDPEDAEPMMSRTISVAASTPLLPSLSGVVHPGTTYLPTTSQPR